MAHASLDLPPRLAVAIGKGGAGKTSVSCNTAGILAKTGWRTLLVCLDPQDNCGEDLGYSHRNESDDGYALVQALLHGEPLRPSLTDVRPDLDVVCAGPLLGEAREEMIRRDVPATVLADALAPLAVDYDIVVIDCPPVDNRLQMVAMVASNWVLAPCGADLSSRKGLHDLAVEFARARELNPELTLAGVVLFDLPANATQVETHTRAFLEAELGGLAPVFQHYIRTSTAGKAARDRGLLIHELAEMPKPPWWQIRRGDAVDPGIPESSKKVARDYVDVTAELLEIINRSTEEAQEAR